MSIEMDSETLSQYLAKSVEFIKFLKGPAIEVDGQDIYVCEYGGSISNEIVGQIVNIRAPIMTNTGKLVLNFSLKINDGLILPFALWQEDLERLQPKIQWNQYVHIDSFFVNACNQDLYSANMPFKLSLISTTQITQVTIKKGSSYCGIPRENVKIEHDIAEAISIHQNNDSIGLDLYLADNFCKVNAKLPILSGILCDKRYHKIIGELMQSSAEIEKMEIGQHVIVYGRILFRDGNTPTLEILSSNDIDILEDKIDEDDIPHYMLTPTKSSVSQIKCEQSKLPCKKLKMDC